MRTRFIRRSDEGIDFGTDGQMTQRPYSSPVLLAAMSLVALSACGNVKPIDYTEPHDIQPGPGLLSGEDGEFLLYGERESDSEKKKK